MLQCCISSSQSHGLEGFRNPFKPAGHLPHLLCGSSKRHCVALANACGCQALGCEILLDGSSAWGPLVVHAHSPGAAAGRSGYCLVCSISNTEQQQQASTSCSRVAWVQVARTGGTDTAAHHACREARCLAHQRTGTPCRMWLRLSCSWLNPTAQISCNQQHSKDQLQLDTDLP
jgi:hypothetical protein